MHSNRCPHNWSVLKHSAAPFKPCKKKEKKTKFYIQVSQIFVLLTGIKIRYVLRSCHGFFKIYEIILQVTVSKHNENYKFSMLPSTAWTKNLYAVGAICTFHLLSGQCLERICSCFFCHFLNAQSFTLHIMFKRLSLKYITPASMCNSGFKFTIVTLKLWDVPPSLIQHSTPFKNAVFFFVVSLCCPFIWTCMYTLRLHLADDRLLTRVCWTHCIPY